MINMKPTTFSLTNLTNSDISRLIEECQREQTQRQHRQAKRKKWVDSMYYAFLAHPNATSIQVDGVTVVSVFNRNAGMRMATARPVHGDAFDRVVGVAVAYAKAIGMTIPDFI
jgi:hypothetical protein